MVEFLPVVLSVLTLSGFGGPGAPSPDYAPVKRSAHELLTAADRHVRATSRDAQELISRGTTRSYTFASLMAAIERTDVIVYVELTDKLPQTVAGRLLFATASKQGPRYLRIQIAKGGSMAMQVAALGHELQHAMEVADAPDVRDELGLGRFYERVGTEGALPRSYDTLAAQVTGRRVLMEVQG